MHLMIGWRDGIEGLIDNQKHFVTFMHSSAARMFDDNNDAFNVWLNSVYVRFGQQGFLLHLFIFIWSCYK